MNKLFLLSVLLLGTVFGLSGRVGTASSDFQDISVTLNAAKYNLSVQTSASGGVWTYGFQEPRDTFSINFSQSGYYPVSFSFGNVSSSRTGLVTYTSATPDNNTYIFINGQGELASTEAYGPDGCVFYRGSNSNFCIGISVYFVTRNNDYYFYINPTYLKHGKYRFATLNSTNTNLAMQFFSKSTGHIPFYRREASTVDAQKPQLWSALDFLHCSWGALVLPVQEIGSAPNNSQWWQYNECLYQPVNISGYVGQANQAPVAGVSITFTDSTGYLKPFTVTTGSDGYYYAQTRTTVFNVVAVKAGYTTYSAARNVTMAGNYVGFPMNPAPATTGPATTGPATTGPATTGPATTGPATTGPATTGPATTGPATTGPATTGPATTGPATTGPATTGPATTGPATTGPATTGPATTGPATTGSATTGESATTGTPTTADSSTTGTTGSINTTTTGQQPVTTTSTTGQSTVVVKVSVNVTVFTFVITNYEEQSFKTNLAAQLNVPKEWIVIVSIAKRQSSVKFYIASNTASSSDDVQTEINKSIEAANELEKILADPALKASLETALGTNVTSSATETETVTVDVTVPSGTTTGPVVDSSATVSVVSFIFVVIMFILVIA